MNAINIVIDCFNVSSGTMATLTGKSGYAEVGDIQNSWVNWVAQHPAKDQFKTWIEAWDAYQAFQGKVN